MVIGSPGAGKSTVTKKLHAVSGLPIIHLDDHYWLEQWKRPTEEFWLQKLRELVAQEKWIIDGNYFSCLDIRLHAADVVIFLDIPTSVCLMRVCIRAMKWLIKMDRESMPLKVRCDVSSHRNKFKVSRDFLSLISLIFFYKIKLRPVIMKKLSSSKARIFILKNSHEIYRFLKDFPLIFQAKL